MERRACAISQVWSRARTGAPDGETPRTPRQRGPQVRHRHREHRPPARRQAAAAPIESAWPHLPSWGHVFLGPAITLRGRTPGSCPLTCSSRMREVPRDSRGTPDTCHTFILASGKNAAVCFTGVAMIKMHEWPACTILWINLTNQCWAKADGHKRMYILRFYLCEGRKRKT